MLPRGLIEGFEKGRLRNLLALFFLALAVPTAVLIWQAYGQLKWESFHHHRGVAEELTQRIDGRFNDMINTADARSFADYTFLVVTGDPSANFVQRSPLSAFPVAEDLPGAIGYFQVDTGGEFSTPLLPAEGAKASSFGISSDEYRGRLLLAQRIQAVLADNRLVRSLPKFGFDGSLETSPAAPSDVRDDENEADEYQDRVSSVSVDVLEGNARTLQKRTYDSKPTAENAAVHGSVYRASGDREGSETPDASLPEQLARPVTYSQQVFDQLNQPQQEAKSQSGELSELEGAKSEALPKESRPNTTGKVSAIKLDAGLQKKSEEVERGVAIEQREDGGRAEFPSRSTRKEQITLPEATPLTDRSATPNVTGPVDLRISTFESEIDPFEFSLLDSGHAVLFRRVWRNGERYIQGLLLDRQQLIEDIIGESFAKTTLSDMSNLITAYQDDVLYTFHGRSTSGYRSGTETPDGALLYRSRLSTPLDSLELIFSIKHLPPGPGASVLAWVTLILVLVFLGGFATLYRLGLGQIDLARQQQDFVSAVSHELKTPLTSIRMYGEMLKEGWADEEKRQGYYEFIHDESERLSRLISNVLQLAKITRNEPDYVVKPTNVGELMSNIESKISSQVERAGFQLMFNCDDDARVAVINIDEDCFAQIIINLVDNAIKFSRDAENKVIEISAACTGDSNIVFAVRDHGPGIPKDQMKRIFNIFYRSESELTRETVGTGIGLAIVHQLTTAMKGKVDLINRNPGVEFRVWFKIAENN